MGDRVLMEDVNAIIPAGAIVGIIGPNGAGKTTLFKMLVGQEQPDTGTVKVGDTVQFAYVDQGRESLEPGKSVYDIISEGHDTIKLGSREVNARAYCTRFNFHGADQQKKVDVLSGGERNRLHLARMLKSGANVLLLDEPTNDIDVNTMRALEDALDNFAGCVLVVSHDRWFLDRIATHIMAFEGDSSVIFFEGNFSEYEEDRKKRLGKEAEPAPAQVPQADPLMFAAAVPSLRALAGMGATGRPGPAFLLPRDDPAGRAFPEARHGAVSPSRPGRLSRLFPSPSCPGRPPRILFFPAWAQATCRFRTGRYY